MEVFPQPLSQPLPLSPPITHNTGLPISPFIFVVNSGGGGGGTWGAGTEGGPSWVGAGGGVIALSSLSQGGLWGKGLEWAGHRGPTRPHKHAGHSTGMGGQAGRRIALEEWSQAGPPPTGAWGEGLEAIMLPPLCEGAETPPWGWGKRLGQ